MENSIIMEKVQFMPEGESRPVDFYVLEEERLGGRQYLLVTDSEDGDGDALVLRAGTAGIRGPALPEGAQEEVSYEIVEDARELSAVLLLMRDALEELGIEVDADGGA